MTSFGIGIDFNSTNTQLRKQRRELYKKLCIFKDPTPLTAQHKYELSVYRSGIRAINAELDRRKSKPQVHTIYQSTFKPEHVAPLLQKKLDSIHRLATGTVDFESEEHRQQYLRAEQRWIEAKEKCGDFSSSRARVLLEYNYYLMAKYGGKTQEEYKLEKQIRNNKYVLEDHRAFLRRTLNTMTEEWDSAVLKAAENKDFAPQRDRAYARVVTMRGVLDHFNKTFKI